MRVLVNAASAHMGGAVTFLKNVLRTLPEVADDIVLVVCVPSSTRPTIQSLAAQNVVIRNYPYADTSGAARVRFDQFDIPRLVRKLGIDVLFSSTGFGTFVNPCPQVLLVRNMAYFDPLFHERYRELGRSLLRNSVRRWHSIASIVRSEVVLFPSHALRDAVSRYVDLPPERTAVIHYGFNNKTFEGSDETFAFADQISQWKAEGYFVLLNVSTYAVQKNYETLVEGMAALRESGKKVKVLTTLAREQTTDTREYDELRKQIEQLGVDQDIVELGYIPYEHLHKVYGLSDAYVFPSFSESFGHSLVEAMAAGLPVIAADTPVNREVCGDAAAYFSSFDGDDCARVIERVLEDQPAQAEMRKRSRQRARSFDWHEYSRALAALFRRMQRTA